MGVHRWVLAWLVLMGAACGTEPLTALDMCDVPGGCAPPVDDGGRDDPPGSGRVYVVDTLAIGEPEVGFDVDERCQPDCVDNALTGLGRFANPTLQSGVQFSHDVLLFEVLGIDEGFAGDDDAVTLAVYRGLDVDDDRTNNFDGAGRLLLDRTSLTTDGLARTRVPAKIRDGRLATEVPFDAAITMSLSLMQRPALPFREVRVAFDLDRDTFANGVLGGAVPAEALFALEEPFCKTVSARCPAPIFDPTLLDFVAQTLGGQPDIDLDGDGAECVVDGDGDGKLDVCCDALPDGFCSPMCANQAPPLDAANPASCVGHEAIADGYSIGLEVTGVAATIVGVAE